MKHSYLSPARLSEEEYTNPTCHAQKVTAIMLSTLFQQPQMCVFHHPLSPEDLFVAFAKPYKFMSTMIFYQHFSALLH